MKVLILMLTLILFGGGAYALRISNQVKSAANKIYTPTNSKKTAKTIKNKKPFAILLLGVDTGAEGRLDKGNSDTMIVATVNPEKKEVKLVSIPRDTLAQLQGADQFNMQKINAAYNVGGSDMAMNTVEKMFDVPINYYVTVNMGGLSKIVDAVGGVDVEVPFTFEWNGSEFTKGQMHLKGKAALDYSRMRYDDPEGDYGRQKRQKQVITSMINSAVSFKSLTNFESILDSLSDSVATNLSFDDMVAVQANYRSAAQSIKSDVLTGRSADIEGSSYQIPTNEEIQRVSDVLRTSLGLEKTTINNAEIKQNNLNTYFTGEDNQQEFTIYPKNVLDGEKSSTNTIQGTTGNGTDTTVGGNTANTTSTWQNQQSTNQWNVGY
ncbi:cell envelope-related function transcriptional attenuator common domain protein [Latilactobacillus graminis DSM 20719]|uniref:Cell envelope-related function transcriptional attenuator common domain protein n=2 Tax=Latilactobacillus graminis TaxID=60519 RepID=A0AA89I2C2_9LACO|nr:LCP family protein [Latilactobacillus graminis]KRM24335.1 cell envelope-related function transcriptional attenuator common domain protein [Latilactobacillus graminis DSM 20719]